ncbi:MAG: hypothetical protein HRU51_03210 [Xanthomonadales bacterium]|nr:hypothetical protein [Xanthomonadales bacterium]
MRKVIDVSAYPLAPALTRRVLGYLAYFRLFIAIALGAAFISGLLSAQATIRNPALAGAVLLAYLGFSLYFLQQARRKDEHHYDLALQSLILDVVLIALLLHTFQGVAVLLVFVGATAGILLPLRLALAVSSLAAIALITQPAISTALGGDSGSDLLGAGTYALTVMVITALTHVLACWARDFRLIAERQMQTVTSLEQINELIIRRLKSGVVALAPDGQIKMMNESAWFLLGSPEAGQRSLADISPQLRIALEEWRNNPRQEAQTMNLDASQAEVVPKFVSLPGATDVSTVIFLEDNDVVSQRALELSSLSLAKLSTSIAHEIRNPLSAITHAAQLLGEDAALDKEQARLVDIISNQSRRMNGIIENILQMSRREKAQTEVIRLDYWLASLCAEFNRAAAGPVFQLDIAEDARDAAILFDRSQLHQILWKLMENARQHLGERHPEPQLFLRLRVEDGTGFCVLSVEDNGKGITRERMGQIFEPFFTTRKAGSGLGLYIARQLCEANQAELTADSVPGQRTRFRIRTALATGRDAGALELARHGS